MTKTYLFVFICVAGCLLSGCSKTSVEDGPKELVISGSGACEVVLTELAAVFNAGHRGSTVTVPKSTGSSGGVRSVIQGDTLVGRVAWPLKKTEEGHGLTVYPFAYDAVVFAVGQDVGLKTLTVEHLADIFSGRIKNWQDVGGSEQPIRVLTRQDDETSRVAIQKTLAPFGGLVFTDEAKTAYHDYEMVDLLNKFTNSIGFLTHGSMKIPGNRMHLLSLDGVLPTADNINSGAYPLKVTLGIVYKKNTLDALAVEFVDFIFSEKGKNIIIDMGLFPIERNE